MEMVTMIGTMQGDISPAYDRCAHTAVSSSAHFRVSTFIASYLLSRCICYFLEHILGNDQLIVGGTRYTECDCHNSYAFNTSFVWLHPTTRTTKTVTEILLSCQLFNYPTFLTINERLTIKYGYMTTHCGASWFHVVLQSITGRVWSSAQSTRQYFDLCTV